MSRIQQPSMEQIAALSSMQEQQQIAQMNAEFRGVCGALFKEAVATYFNEHYSSPEKDAKFFEQLSIRCLNAAKAYHAVFGIFHTDDAEANIANVKEALARHAKDSKKGKLATE